MQVDIKICGLSTAEAIRAALKSGADYLGFIHFPKSPRHLELSDMAVLMQQARDVTPDARLVSVVVDPDDALIDALRDKVKPGLI